MFWAKTNAIHQIFDKNIVEKIKKKNIILDNIIQHCIERIWFYIVKLNGYYYKKVFKHI
jgi:lipopolysaccharide biosynthesis protein